MILYVDYEHASTYLQPGTDWLLAARTRISYRLQDLTGQPCLLQRYPDVTPRLVADLGVEAVFISGNGADPTAYDRRDLAGLAEIVGSGDLPVFGFCGGFQFIGEVLGAPLDRIGRLGDGEADPNPEYQPGWRTELGYEPVELIADHELLSGLDDMPVFRHAHAQELTALPDGFVNLARTDVTEIQFMAHEERPIAGTQFHPEYWTDQYPAGRILIENFCRLHGLMDPALRGGARD